MAALGAPAPRSLPGRRSPALFVVATEDGAIDAELLRSTARRIGAETTEVPGSHVAFLTQPAGRGNRGGRDWRRCRLRLTDPYDARCEQYRGSGLKRLLLCSLLGRLRRRCRSRREARFDVVGAETDLIPKTGPFRNWSFPL